MLLNVLTFVPLIQIVLQILMKFSSQILQDYPISMSCDQLLQILLLEKKRNSTNYITKQTKIIQSLTQNVYVGITLQHY